MNQMTIEEATTLLFRRLCNDFKTRGKEAEMSRQSLGSGIPEEIFMAALRQLRGPANDQDMQVEFIERNADRMRLGASWRGRCANEK